MPATNLLTWALSSIFSTLASLLGLSGGLPRPPRCAQPTAVCALLGSKDLWFETDFAVFHELFGAPDKSSIWLCAEELSGERIFLAGDPACDRVVFHPQHFETVLGESDLKNRYLEEVSKQAKALSGDDTLVLLLLGHEDQNGTFRVGNNRLILENLQNSVHGTKATVFLFCYLGNWVSPLWTLVTAGEGKEAESGSDQVGGGFFANTLATKNANKINFNTPDAEPVNNQELHDSRPDALCELSTFSQHHQSLQIVDEWMHQWRDKIGQTYRTTDFAFCPVSMDSSPLLPFQSLKLETSILHGFRCTPPRTKISATSPISRTALSAEEKEELYQLAVDYNNSKPFNTFNEVGVIALCLQLLSQPHSTSTMTDGEAHHLYSELKERKRLQELALSIAQNLGWEGAIEEIGEPGHIKQQQHRGRLALRRDAETSGCLVNHIVREMQPERDIWLYTGAADWLARVWRAAGSPVIGKADWDLAVKWAKT